MLFIINPIDQFLVIGPCSHNTNYMLATFLGILIFGFLSWVQNYSVILNKITGILSGLRSAVSDVILSVQGYTSYMAFLFLLILSYNLIGMIPYTLTITSFASTTICLSLTAFLGLNLIALTLHSSKLVDLFLPSGAPLAMSWFLIILETVSYLVRVLSLAIRLFANMLAGHALTKILGSFAWTMFGAGLIGIIGVTPWAILFAITFLELLICILQAYVFITLISLYINDILHMH